MTSPFPFLSVCTAPFLVKVAFLLLCFGPPAAFAPDPPVPFAAAQPSAGFFSGGSTISTELLRYRFLVAEDEAAMIGFAVLASTLTLPVPVFGFGGEDACAANMEAMLPFLSATGLSREISPA